MNLIEKKMKHAMMSLVSYMTYGKWQLKTAYSDIYNGQEKSRLIQEIFKEAFGEEFPEDLDNFSFVTLTDLNNIATFFNINSGELIADIACGRGGPGMWVARKTGANLIGVDISEDAVRFAKNRIPEFDLKGRADFNVGNFYQTGLETNSCNSVMCVDALWMAVDREQTFSEINRAMKTGGRFVFTTWEGNIPFLRDDIRTLLQNSGFEVIQYQETEGWKERQLSVYEKIMENKNRLIQEMGQKYAGPILKEAKSTPAILDNSRRVMIVAEKK